MQLVKETRWSRQYEMDDLQTKLFESKFADGSATISVADLEQERRHGLDRVAAIRQAAVERFRPILMTTLAAALGALPLAIGFGEGAELRRPLGIAIFGGLVLSQILTLFTTPVIYLAFDRLGRRFARRRAETQA